MRSTSSERKAELDCVDPLDAFAERAGARAYLWSIGEFELAEAADELQHTAERDGLVDRIGQDQVQLVMALAFKPYCDEGAS